MLPASSFSQTELPKLQPSISDQILKWFILHAASEEEADRDIEGEGGGENETHTHKHMQIRGERPH